MRWALALVVVLLAVALAPPPGSAQTFAQPLCAPPAGLTPEAYCTYESHYLVMGRVLDVNGKPAKGARVTVTLDQDGVRDAQGARPAESGSANCKGDFEFSFAGLRQVLASGRARVAVPSPDGGPSTEVEHAFDTYYRRSDVVVRLPYAWTYECTQKPDPPWETQVSVKGRVVNGTPPRDVGGVTYHAEGYEGQVGLRIWANASIYDCPPDGQGGCAPIGTDPLGNFKYTWVYPARIEPTGWIEVLVPSDAGLRSFNFTVDPDARLALALVDVSGRGPPPGSPIPSAPLALLLAALGVAAVVSRRR